MIVHEIKRLYILFSLFIILGVVSVHNAAASSSCAEKRPLIDVHNQPKIKSIAPDTIELLNNAVSKTTNVQDVRLFHKDEYFFVREGRTIIPIKRYLIDKELRELSLSQDKLITFLQTGGCVQLSQNGCGDYTLKLSGRLLGGSPLVALAQAAKWLFSAAAKKAAQEAGKKVAQQAMADSQQTVKAITGIGGGIIFGVSKVKNWIFGRATTASAPAPKPHSARSLAPVAVSKPQSASSAPKLQSVSVSQASSPKASSAPATAQTHSLAQSAAASKSSCPQSSSSLAPTQSTPKPQSTPATAIHIPKPTTTIKDSVVPAALQKVATSSPPQTQPVATSAPQTATITTAPAAQPVAVTDTKVAVPAASVSVSIPQQPVTHITALRSPQKVEASGLSAQVRTIPVSTPDKAVPTTQADTVKPSVPTVHGSVPREDHVSVIIKNDVPNLADKVPTTATTQSAQKTETFITQVQQGKVGDIYRHNKEIGAINNWDYDELRNTIRARNIERNRIAQMQKAVECSRLRPYIGHPSMKIAKEDRGHFSAFSKEDWKKNFPMPIAEKMEYTDFYKFHTFRDSIQSSKEFPQAVPILAKKLETDPAFAKRCASAKIGEHTDMSVADCIKGWNDQRQRIESEAAAVKAARSATPSTSNNQPAQSVPPLVKTTTEPAFAKPPCKPVVEIPEKPQGCPAPLPVPEKPTGCGTSIPQQPQPTPGCGGNLPEELTKPIGCGEKPYTPEKDGCEKTSDCSKKNANR